MGRSLDHDPVSMPGDHDLTDMKSLRGYTTEPRENSEAIMLVDACTVFISQDRCRFRGDSA